VTDVVLSPKRMVRGADPCQSKKCQRVGRTNPFLVLDNCSRRPQLDASRAEGAPKQSESMQSVIFLK